jgi:simple sugar transport system ATP-binding protein
MLNNIIKMENIEKWYGKVHALKGVDFSVSEGEVVGLIGENGAGKSSLIKIISGLFPPDKGKIYWEGREVTIDSVKKARELGIETIHQNRLTIDTLDVSENIFLSREIKKNIGPLKIIDKVKQNEKAIQLTSELGLKIDSPEEEVRLCSGGEKQGVAIARALYYKSKLLILDEPTVGLTIEGIRQLKKYIKKITNENNAGCIFITHNFRHIIDIADRYVVLIRGSIVNELSNKNIKVKDLVKEFFYVTRQSAE